MLTFSIAVKSPLLILAYVVDLEENYFVYNDDIGEVRYLPLDKPIGFVFGKSQRVLVCEEGNSREIAN